MTISQLIQQLQELQQTHGDLPVYRWEWDGERYCVLHPVERVQYCGADTFGRRPAGIEIE